MLRRWARGTRNTSPCDPFGWIKSGGQKSRRFRKAQRFCLFIIVFDGSNAESAAWINDAKIILIEDASRRMAGDHFVSIRETTLQDRTVDLELQGSGGIFDDVAGDCLKEGAFERGKYFRKVANITEPLGFESDPQNGLSLSSTSCKEMKLSQREA